MADLSLEIGEISNPRQFKAQVTELGRPAIVKPAGHREVLTLDSAMKKYITACEGTDHGEKNWNFPKFHARWHVFDDIEKKEASRNFGTKTSESMHGAIRNTYHRLTNFKDVTPQVMPVTPAGHAHLPIQLSRSWSSMITAVLLLRSSDQLDAFEEELEEVLEDLEGSLLSNIDIGSKLSPVSFSTVEQTMSPDPAFDRFRIKFGDFVSDFLPAHGGSLPDGKHLQFEPHQEIVPFQFLKVYYDSLSTWSSTADYLRCNPDFHGHPRYDGVLVETEDKPIFARLISLFSFTVEKKSHTFALVLPLDAPTGWMSKKDKALRFHQVCAKPRKKSEFISAYSIVRGALLAPDFNKPEEFIVFDVVDGGMSLHLNSLYPSRWDTIV
ncbi:hypothetical protein DFH09DRAFT_1090277 [Mycena vulgaris]|nr:hypothetical protein DFH09DRAFT_1090277 [Mycena vulgaris]